MTEGSEAKSVIISTYAKIFQLFTFDKKLASNLQLLYALKVEN
jgi:hypothetical protein